MEGQSSRGGESHAGSGAEPTRHPSPAGRVRARADPFLIACRGFSVITSLAAILCIAVNVISAVRSFKNGSDVFDGIFRCYAVVIAVFVVVAETGVGIRHEVLEGSGVLGRQGNAADLRGSDDQSLPQYLRNREDLFLLQSISSYLLIACGMVYIISGIFCIGMVKRARQKKELSREQAVKDLEDLERRREELESMLLDHQA